MKNTKAEQCDYYSSLAGSAGGSFSQIRWWRSTKKAHQTCTSCGFTRFQEIYTKYRYFGCGRRKRRNEISHPTSLHTNAHFKRKRRSNSFFYLCLWSALTSSMQDSSGGSYVKKENLFSMERKFKHASSDLKVCGVSKRSSSGSEKKKCFAGVGKAFRFYSSAGAQKWANSGGGWSSSPGSLWFNTCTDKAPFDSTINNTSSSGGYFTYLHTQTNSQKPQDGLRIVKLDVICLYICTCFE